jgi:hypothetical protein
MDEFPVDPLEVPFEYENPALFALSTAPEPPDEEDLIPPAPITFPELTSGCVFGAPAFLMAVFTLEESVDVGLGVVLGVRTLFTADTAFFAVLTIPEYQAMFI